MEGAEEELKRISVSDWSSECHPGTCQPRGDHWLGSSPKQRHQLLWVKLMQSCQPSIAHPHRQPPDKSPLISASTGKAPVNKRNNRTSRCLTPKKTLFSHQVHEVSLACPPTSPNALLHSFPPPLLSRWLSTASSCSLQQGLSRSVRIYKGSHFIFCAPLATFLPKSCWTLEILRGLKALPTLGPIRSFRMMHIKVIMGGSYAARINLNWTFKWFL